MSGLDHARHTCFLRCCFRVGTVHASCNHKDVLGVVLHGVLKLVVLAHACKQGLSIPAQFILLLLQDRLPHACALRCVRWICEGVLGVWGVLGDFGTPLHFLCNLSLTPDHVWVSLSRKVGKQADFCCPAACHHAPFLSPSCAFCCVLIVCQCGLSRRIGTSKDWWWGVVIGAAMRIGVMG